MDWRHGLVLFCVGAVLGIGAMFLVMQSRQSAWLTKEKELVEESIRWQHTAGEHGKRAAASQAKAAVAQAEADAAIAAAGAVKPSCARQAHHADGV